MAGQYQNMIRDLIIQSRLNNHLVNDTNNTLDHDEFTLDEIKERHTNRIDREYAFHNMNLPIYDYFDGTQLINSLFSRIVVPVEFLKGRFGLEKVDKAFKERSPNLYYECLNRIRGLDNVVTNYYRGRNNIKVYPFFKRLRNALCHSGNGNIHFFPSVGRDITHLYFYDDESKYDKNTKELISRKVFLVKMHILDELLPLVDVFDELVMKMAVEDTRFLDMQSIEERIAEAGVNLPYLHN